MADNQTTIVPKNTENTDLVPDKGNIYHAVTTDRIGKSYAPKSDQEAFYASTRNAPETHPTPDFGKNTSSDNLWGMGTQFASQDDYYRYQSQLATAKLKQENPNFNSPGTLVVPAGPGTEAGRYLNTYFNEGTYVLNSDNEERNAQNQSWIAQLRNSFIKGGATAVGTFVDGFMTYPDVVGAIKDGKLSSLYQSPWENSIDKFLNNLENKLPNYYTHWEQEHPFLSAFNPKGMANFWGDQIIKNIGFTVGAIGGAVLQDAIVGSITGGLGDVVDIPTQVGKLALWLSKIGTTSEDISKALEGASDALKLSNKISDLRTIAKYAAGTRKLGNTAEYIATLFSSARTEGGWEARQGYNKLKADLIQEYRNAHEGADPDQDTMRNIEDTATASANVRFVTNLGILMLSDAIQFDSFLNSFKPTRKGLSDALKVKIGEANEIGLKEGSLDAFEEIKPKGIKQKLLHYSKKNLIPGILSEGVYEEGLQNVAQEGTYNYYHNKYYNKDKDTFSDILKSTTSAFAKTYGSSSGLENVFVGALMSAVTGPITERFNASENKKVTARTLEALNSNQLTGTFQQKYDNATTAEQISKDMRRAAVNDNLFEYKNLKHDAFYHFITSALNVGRFGVRVDQLELLKEVNDEDFNKMFGYASTDEHRKEVSTYVDSLINKAKEIKKDYEAIHEAFSNPYTKDEKATTAEGLLENYHHDLHNQLLDNLGRYTSMLRDGDERIKNIQDGWSKDLKWPVNIDTLTKATTDFGLSQYAEEFKETDPNLSKKITSLLKAKKELGITDLSENKELNKTYKEVVRSIIKKDNNVEFMEPYTTRLINEGADINLIRQRSHLATIYYNYLSSEEGQKAFFDKDREERLKTVLEEANKPEAKKVTVKTQAGDETRDTEFTEGKNYYILKEDKGGRPDIVYGKATSINDDSTIDFTPFGDNTVRLSHEDLGKSQVYSDEDFTTDRGKLFLKSQQLGQKYKMQVGTVHQDGKLEVKSEIQGNLVYFPTTDRLSFRFWSKKANKPLSRTVSPEQFDPGYKGNHKMVPEGPNRVQAEKAEKLSAERLKQQRLQDAKDIEDNVIETVQAYKAQVEEVNKLITTTEERLTKDKERLAKYQEKLADNESVHIKAETAVKRITAFNKLIQDSQDALDNLSAQKEELEYVLSRIEHIGEGLKGEDNVEDTISKLEESKENLRKTIKATNNLIATLQRIINTAKKAFEDAKATINKILKRFSNIKISNERLNNLNIGFREKEINDIIATNDPYSVEYQMLQEITKLAEDIDAADKLVEENKKVATVTGKTLDTSQKRLSDLQDKLKEYNAEYKANEALLKTFYDKIDTREKQRQAAEEMAANAERKRMLFGASNAVSKGSGDPVSEPGTVEDFTESAKKNTTDHHRSSIMSQPDEVVTVDTEGNVSISLANVNKTVSPHQKRYNNLLNYVGNVKDRENLGVILVTANNEHLYGLKGLSQSQMDNAVKAHPGVYTTDGTTQISLTDPDKGIISIVFVRKKDGKITFIDKEGNDIKPSEVRIDNTQQEGNIIYATMESPNKEWLKGGSRYRENTSEQEINDEIAKVKHFRAQIFKYTPPSLEETNVFPFSVSRGFPRIPNNYSNQNDVVSSGLLQDASILANKQVIQVSTGGFIKGETGNVPLKTGLTVFVHGGNIQQLNNRNPTENEVKTLYEAIHTLADKADKNWADIKQRQKNGEDTKGSRVIDDRLINFLNGVLFWGSPKKEKGTGKSVEAYRNQIWIDTDGLHMGKYDQVIPFTRMGVEANKDLVIEFLKGTYNTVNNSKLQKLNAPFYEFTGVKEGEPQYTVWRNYQSYLISPTYILSIDDKSNKTNGDKREGDLPLSVNLPNIDTSKDYPYAGKYIVMGGIEDAFGNNTVEQSNNSSVEKTKNELESKFGKVNSLGTYVKNIANIGVIMVGRGRDGRWTTTLKIPERDNNGKIKYTSNGAFDDPQYNIENKYFGKDEKGFIEAANEGLKLLSSLTKQTTPTGIVADGKTDNSVVYTAKDGKSKLNIHFIIGENEEGNLAVEVNPKSGDGPDLIERLKKAGITDEDQINDQLTAIVRDALIQNGLAKIENNELVLTSPSTTNVVESSPIAGESITREEEIAEKEVNTAKAEDRLNKVQEGINTGELFDDEDYGNTEYRTATDTSVSPIEQKDMEYFQSWVKENLPQFTIQQVDHLINMIGGGKAYGEMTGNLIKLFSKAPKGTEFHEAFEAVWAYFVSPEEQDKVLSQVRKRAGTFFDSTTGNTISYKDATGHQLKEKIADEFGDYKYNQKGKSLLTKVFDRIIYFFKNLLHLNGEMERLFNRIDSGEFNSYKIPAKNNLHGLNSPQYRVNANLPIQVIQDTLDEITYSIMVKLSKGDNSLFDINNVPAKELYDNAKAVLTEKLDKFTDLVTAKMVKKGFSKEDTLAQIRVLDNYAKQINDNWDQFVRESKELLKVFNVEINDEGQLDANDPNRTQQAYDRDWFKTDPIKGATTAMKLLMATLSETVNVKDATGMPKSKYSTIGGVKLVNFAKTFVQTMEGMQGASSLTEMMDRLVEMGKDDPNFIPLFKRLGGDLGKGKLDYQNLDFNKWRLLLNYFTSFSKQKPTAFIQYRDAEGTVYSNPAGFKDKVRAQVADWMENAKSMTDHPGSIIKYNKGSHKYYIDKSKLGEIPLSDPKKALALLDKLGIHFTEDTLKSLSKADESKFYDNVGYIHHTLKTFGEGAEIAFLTAKALTIEARLDTLGRLYTIANNIEAFSVFYDHEGEMRQFFIPNNRLSVLVDHLNRMRDISDLATELPHIANDSFAGHAVTLKEDGLLFDHEGKRREDNPLEVAYILGNVDTDSGFTKGITKMTYNQRHSTEINMNAKGYYYTLSAVDSNTEYMINWGNQYEKGAVDNTKRTRDIFTGYLKDEARMILEAKQRSGDSLELSTNGLATKLRFMEDILSHDKALVNAFYKEIAKHPDDKTIDAWIDKNADKIAEAAVGYFNFMAKRQMRNLVDTGIITVTGDTYGGWDLLDTANAKVGKSGMVKDLLEFLTAREANFTINNIEQHKLLYGDPFAIKDGIKRSKTGNSPRSTTYNGKEYAEYANTNRNSDYKDGELGKVIYKDYAVTSTLADVNIISALALMEIPENAKDKDKHENNKKEYTNVDQTDGSAIGGLPFFKQFNERQGVWGKGQQEFYDYDHALARYEGSERGKYTYQDKSLKAKDKELIERYKGKYPTSYIFSVIKPIVFGPKANSLYNDVVIDKYSIFPMSYTLARENNMEDFYWRMFNSKDTDGISQYDYAIFKSGRKRGAEATDNLYNEGKVETAPFKSNIQVGWDTIGTISEVSYHDENKLTEGTQTNNLTPMDLMENGKPIDVELSDEAWHSITDEDEKERLSPLYKKVRHFHKSHMMKAEFGYQMLLKKWGIVDKGGYYEMRDKTPIAKLLQDEMFRRMLPDNVKDAIRINPTTGDFYTHLEATNAYTQIMPILMSQADRSFISQRVNGVSAVQIPSVLFEKNERNAVYKEGNTWRKVGEPGNKTWEQVTKEKIPTLLTSDHYKFYTPEFDEEGNISSVARCEIGISSQAIRKSLPKSFDNKSDKELLDYLNKTEDGQELLKGMAFRIPTSGLNLMEAFTIKEFLPSIYGDTVVVPAEITKKTNSDFDIDKLNIYLKNTYSDAKGEVKVVPLLPSKEEHDKLFGQIFEEKLANNRKRTSSKLKDTAFRNQIAGNALFSEDEGGLSEKQLDKYEGLIEEIFANSKGPNGWQDVVDDLFDKVNKLNTSLNKLNDSQLQAILKEKFLDDTYQQALENNYFDRIQDIILDPVNYFRLTTPNETDTLKQLKKDLYEAKDIKDEGINPLIDSVYLSHYRQNNLVGKSNVGQYSLSQIYNTLFQQFPIYIDPERVNAISDPFIRGILGDGNPHSKHKTVEVNGKKVASFSSITDVKGNHISNIINQLTGGAVDMSKGQELAEIKFVEQRGPIAMAMLRAGLDPHTAMWLVNQPIIEEYIKMLNQKGTNSLLYEFNVKKIKEKFKGGKDKNTFDESKLKDNIVKYRTGKFTAADMAEQRAILDEVLYFAVVADHLFQVNQAINYDRADFSDTIFIANKAQNMENVRENSIFANVDKILDNTSLGVVMDNLEETRNALGSFLRFEKPDVRGALDKIKSNFFKPGMFVSAKTKKRIGKKVISSFIDYLLQTQLVINGKPLNQLIQEKLLDPKNAVADAWIRISNNIKNSGSSWGNNPIIRDLTIRTANAKGDRPRNLSLNLKSIDPQQANAYTQAFREIRTKNRELYNNLVYLSLLQSGIDNSPISYTSFIPVEDYSELLNPIIERLDSTNFRDFVENGNFFRNNWTDNNIVPEVKVMDNRGDSPYGHRWPHDNIPNSMKDWWASQGNKTELIGLTKQFNRKESNFPYVKIKRNKAGYTSQQRLVSAQAGDYTYRETILYQQVLNAEGKPLTIGKDNNVFVYKPVNAWGAGFSAREQYNGPTQSVIQNDTVKIESETPDATFQQYVRDIKGGIESSENQPNSSVNTGFVAKNKEQSDTISSAIDFIKNGDPSKWFLIQGKAGTGKTTIAKEIIEPFRGNNTIVIAALAHKAKKVLLKKINHNEPNNKKVAGYSIAGLLGMKMDEESGKFISTNSFIPPPISNADIVLIDEASMLNEQAIKLIMQLKPKNAKVIMMGDIGQLPPIREKGDINSGKVSPSFTSSVKSDLFERVRQGEESPILPYADNYWNNSVNAKTPTLNPVQNNERANKITSSGNLVFSKTFGDIKSFVVDKFKQAIKNGNPNLIKVITYRNATRKHINNSIRDAIFGNNPLQFENGDILMFYDNYEGLVNGRLSTIDNSTEVSVTSIRPTSLRFSSPSGKSENLKVVEITAKDDEGNTLVFPTISNEDKVKYTSLISDAFNYGKSLPIRTPQRANAMAQAWKLKGALADIDYGYAITSHKSQGSTYNTSVVMEDDIMGVGPTSNAAKSQSMYTAITRASNTAIILSGNNPTTTTSQELDNITSTPNSITDISSKQDSTLTKNTQGKYNIWAGTNENSILSNLANRPFIYNGAEFDSVEQAFQESKLQFTKGTDADIKVHDSISTEKDGFKAKTLGRGYKTLDTKRWDENSSKIMKIFILESFKQNPNALKALLSTGNTELTHTQDKGKWGKEFPKLLMEVRSELSSQQEPNFNQSNTGSDEIPSCAK